MLKSGNALAVCMILAFACLNLLSVLRGFSLTADEDKHYRYGRNILAGDSTRFDDSKMPVTGLNALPEKIGSWFGDGRLKELFSRFYTARSVTILFACLLAWLVFHWSRQLYGWFPAIFSLTLYVLDPNILAHAQLVTTDLYAALTITWAFYALWKFANTPSRMTGLVCLVALGLAQIAKYTAIVLYPLFLINLLIFDAPGWIGALREKIGLFRLMSKYVSYAIYALVTSLLIINLGFLFNQPFTAFGKYQFTSAFFTGLQNNVPLLHDIPVPTPYPYLQGLDLIRRNEQAGGSYGNIYLLGHRSSPEGFPGYFFIAALLKVPLATQLILLLAFILYFLRKKKRSSFRINEAFLLVPILFFTVYFNFFFNTQIGIRFLLPVFPLLYTFAGHLFTGWQTFSRWQKSTTIMLVAYLFISVFSYHPYYLSYFNEIVWDRKMAYKYLADSNIDWGQSRNELDEYLQQHPDAIYRTGKIQSGHLVVRVNDLVGVLEPERYAWLRNNFEPVDTIAYSYLVYQISDEDIDNLCQTTDYCKP